MAGKTKKPMGEPMAEETMTVPQAQAMFDELKALIAERFDEVTEFAQQISEAADSRLNAIEARLHVAPKPGRETHTVVEGDSLAKIAKTHLGASGRFPEIMTLNQARYPSLATSNHVEEGWVLELP